MRKLLVFLFFGLYILLSACVPQAYPTIVPVMEETYTPKVLEELPPPSGLVETETTLPPNPTPTQLQPSGVTSPVFVFVRKDTLVMQVSENSPKELGILDDLGEIEDALLLDDTLYLLRENGIQRINLTINSSDIVFRFDASISSGKLLWDANNSRFFYDGITSAARDSLIGYYDLNEKSIHPLIAYKDPMVTLQLIGVTEDGQGLYCLPHGQDPDFGKIFIVNIDQGSISKELPVRGYNYAALAPDSRSLATSAQVIDVSGQIENMINIYDLPSLPLTSPKILKLPNQTSVIGNNGFYWHPDGKSLYFMLIENKDDPSTSSSDAVWLLDVETGSMHKVANITDSDPQLIGVSPDGARSLVRFAINDQVYMVDSKTGEIDSFHVPLDAILVGWQ